MSEEYPRRGRNWLTAMGVLFLVVATVTLVRDIIIWSPDFVVQFFFDSEINAQKVSLGAIAFGTFMVVLGFGKKNVQVRWISSKLKYAKTCNYWQNLQFNLRQNLVFPYLEEIPI